ncbi:MAG: winged helix-turn-helix domain-containing protein [Candidatus Hadarchaeales archaeon]
MEERILEALCNRERLLILQALSKGPSPLSALKEALGRSYSDLLHHLKALQNAGLVEVIKLRPRLTVAYLKFDLEIKIGSGSEPEILLKPRPPPAESELMMAYWRLLTRK